ncbi:GyrI-like domain-containing protein [Hydrogenophaga sp. MI9]|uniref:GyrI-like domain-containing protein n=1 Tax=Hydrogenophaga sp. MI9 TaxID=3453719 RepID=UPI003EEBCFD3
MNEKIDLKKTLKDLYLASAKEPAVVEVPTLRYLMVDGEGDPNTAPAYAEAVEALFSVSYTAKFMVKKGPQAIDYGVMPLEGLWWSDDLSAFRTGAKDRWKWTAMVLQPDFVSDELIAEAIDEVRKKKKLPGVDRLRLDRLTEGRCAQILHVGPFSEEGPTIERLHDFITGRSALRGKHHEIYLSDIRRAEPAKWKTIVRQPMA